MSDEAKPADERAAADLALCDAASPGPWRAEPMNVRPGVYLYGPLPPDYSEPAPPGLLKAHRPQVFAPQDGRFVARAREALPYWIGRALAAEARVKDLEEAVEALEGR